MADKESAPVLVKLPPPIPVRLARVSWVISLVLGACAIVYLVLIRASQLPDIAKLVESVDDTRAEQTYSTTADIIFWSFFGVIVAIALVQIALLVSFSNRRPNIRWWLLATFALQGVVLLLARELVAIGERGQPVVILLVGQLAMGVVGLLLSVLPPALRWTAQRHDIRRGPG